MSYFGAEYFLCKVTITAKNIDRYRTGLYLSKSITWEVRSLDARVLRNFPNLERLCCSFAGLESLDGLEGCPKLIKLDCGHNNLTTLCGLKYTPLLQKLDCGRNKLTTLRGLEGCPHLQRLECINSKLRSLTGIEGCTEIAYLDCGINKLTSLSGISPCSRLLRLTCCFNKIRTIDAILADSLQELIIYSNALTSLAGIESCTRLQNLDCNDNGLHTLKGLDACKQLRKFQCSNNRIKSLEPIVYLSHLQSIEYSGNPLDVQSVQVQRRLGRIKLADTTRSVYNDSQSVHNINVQKCVCESVQRLLQDPKPTFSVDMVVESGMDERAIRLLLEYCDDESVHSAHLLSFKELLGYVWTRICRSEHKAELIKILGEQMCDSECKCFTGRINRLVSVLAGFDSDIVIEISDSSRIGAIILAVKEKVKPYDPVIHHELAHKLLIEAGYVEDEIQSWIDAIND